MPATSSTASSPDLIWADDDDVRYPGGKSQEGLHQWICDRLPDHVWYAEPFAGKGGIFRNKVPALRTWLIDRDPAVLDWWRRRIDREHRRERGQLSHVEILQACGIEWIERMRRRAPLDLLVYCDPPYVPQTRVRQKLYRHEMTLADHKRFLRAVVELPCLVAVSGYMSSLYAERLAGWTLQTREVVTRGGVLRTECLWTNAAASNASAVAMHYSELGPDFRTRERVARKVARWERNFERLPPAERRAILLGLMNAERSQCRRREW